MSAAEIETFKADKTRRGMEESRQKRMRALEEREAAERDPNDPAGWGGSDEEVCLTSINFMFSVHSLYFVWALWQPEEKQLTLMERTAASISRSKNPQQLEMRILANHGSDPRFAFLRGRWRRAWEHIKEPPPPRPIAAVASNLSGLADYAEDSESEDSEQSPPHPRLSEIGSSNDTILGLDKSMPDSLEMPAVQTERRERAKLWAAKRRADATAGPPT
jgi:hypothetical protein